MARRVRVPGPIARDQTLGNTKQRVDVGVGPWTSIDINDGSWTKYDPNSLIINATTSANGVTFELDRLQTNKRWTAGSQNTGRYYREFEGPFGRLTWTDRFTTEFLVEIHSITGNTGSCDRAGVCLGICDSDVENSNSVNWVGMTSLTKDISPLSLQGQIGGDSNTANGTHSNTIKLYSCIGPPIDDDDAADTNPVMPRGFMYNIDTNGDQKLSTAMATQTHEYTSSDPLYMFLAFSFGTTTSPTNNPEFTYKMWYRINMAPDVLSPTYVPGGGVSG